MKLLIECFLKRPGGTRVDLDGVTYHFTETADPMGLGRQACEVSNTKHAQRFLGIAEGYRILELDDVPSNTGAPIVTTPAPAVIPAPIPGSVDPQSAGPVTLIEPEPVNEDGGPVPVPVAAPVEAPVASVTLPTDEELAAMDIDALRLQAEKEIGRKPSPKAKEALLISQILASRQPA